MQDLPYNLAAGGSEPASRSRPHPLALLRPDKTVMDLWRQRSLIVQLSNRQIAARYRGSLLGIVWSLMLPLFMLAIYTFVFSVVFEVRWGADLSSSRLEFAMTLFCGLVLFEIFGETARSAPQLVISHTNFVKRVVFPLQILPVVQLVSALFHGAVSLGLLIVAVLAATRSLPPTIVALPLVILPLVMLSLGMGWFLASVGVYVRDLVHAISILVMALFFLTPVFYPISAVPPSFQAVMQWNPLAVVIESARDVLLWNQWPAWDRLAATTLTAALVMQFGYVWFMRTKRGFADVL